MIFLNIWKYSDVTLQTPVCAALRKPFVVACVGPVTSQHESMLITTLVSLCFHIPRVMLAWLILRREFRRRFVSWDCTIRGQVSRNLSPSRIKRTSSQPVKARHQRQNFYKTYCRSLPRHGLLSDWIWRPTRRRLPWRKRAEPRFPPGAWLSQPPPRPLRGSEFPVPRPLP